MGGEVFRVRCFDFTAKHFHEAARGRPMPDGCHFGRGRTATKSVLQSRAGAQDGEALGAPPGAAAPAADRDDAVPEPAPDKAGDGSRASVERTQGHTRQGVTQCRFARPRTRFL